MSRTHYTAADLERLSCNVKDVRTVITFRNEQLMNLWFNEMQGQISDGMWENSSHTDWLWSGCVVYQIGPETKVETMSKYGIRKSYPLVKELWDVIGYRLYGEKDETTAGYATEKEVRAAWRELATAIYNVTEISFRGYWWMKKKEAEAEFRQQCDTLEKRATRERRAVTGSDYSGTYLDKENRKLYMMIDIKKNVKEGTYCFIVNKVFKIQEGHLQEGLDNLRKLAMTSKEDLGIEIISVY